MNEHENIPGLQKSPDEWATYWGKELNASKKWMLKFQTTGEKVENQYLSQVGDVLDNAASARFNIFWSNVQVILSAIYSKLPSPEVQRTHNDAQDDIARVAANILKRIFDFELKNLDESPDDVYRKVIIDRFVPGMGVAWPRYAYSSRSEQVPMIQNPMTGAMITPEQTMEVITDESAPLDYVRWSDFFYSPCRTWEGRRWIARRVHMNKDIARKRFGEDVANGMEFKNGFKSSYEDDPLRQSPEPLAEVYEIWDYTQKGVFWYATGSKKLLDQKPDPLGLSNFWPVKRVLHATLTSRAFLPRADYTFVQDQYEELNLIAYRTKMLTEALRVVGIYDKNSEPLSRILGQAADNQMIPVDNWALFAEKGGIKGVVDWFPLEMVVNTLDKLSQRKAALLQEIYEVLGLSDIMRGMSVASETATAQQLKAQFGSARMQRVQAEIAEFITMLMRTRAEIICRHWQPETILARSQIMNTPDAELAMQAIQFMKMDPTVAMRLTITADTIAAPNWNEEKQQKTEFLQAVSQFITMSMPLVQSHPGAAMFLVQILQWTATGFKGAQQIEGILDQALQAITMAAAQPQQPQEPSPQDKKDLASADKYSAEALVKNIEAKKEARGMVGPLNPPGVQMPPGHQGPGRPPGTAMPGPGQGQSFVQ